MANIDGLLEKYKTIENERFFGDIFVGNEYEAVLDKPARIIIDVGALAGEFSAYMYDKADTIYAIEPYDPYYAELRANVAEFGLEKIKTAHVAIGGENKSGYIDRDSVRGGNKLVAGDDTAQPIAVMTLATFMQNRGITHVDILKIDIEGAEQEVFTAADITQVLPNISLIIGEHLEVVSDVFLANGFTKTPAGGPNIIYEKTSK